MTPIIPLLFVYFIQFLQVEEKGDKSEEEEVKKEANADIFYDKKKSFFDGISCEAQEKAEGKSGRPDWKKERETNQETFGHSAVRSMNYRRGFGHRGRGGPRGGSYGQGWLTHSIYRLYVMLISLFRSGLQQLQSWRWIQQRI